MHRTRPRSGVGSLGTKDDLGSSDGGVLTIGVGHGSERSQASVAVRSEHGVGVGTTGRGGGVLTGVGLGTGSGVGSVVVGDEVGDGDQGRAGCVIGSNNTGGSGSKNSGGKLHS